MKTMGWALALTVATGVIATQAANAQQASGHVGLSYGQTDVELGPFDADGDAWGANGSVAFGQGVVFQGDLTYTSADDADVDAFTGTGHIYARNDSHAIGGFVGLIDADGGDGWVIGGEGAKFLSNSTLVGSLGYGNADDADVDLYGLNGQARFFASDNLRFDIGLGYLRAESGPVDTDGYTIGAGVEWQFATAPFSVYAGVERAELNDFDLTADTILIGGRFVFGSDSLKQRDRAGTTFSPLGNLGNVLANF